MISSDADKVGEDTQRSSKSGPLTAIVALARLSRLTLLYHKPVPGNDNVEREQLAALLAAVSEGDEVPVLFDAGSDLPLPDLLADIESAVLKARPQAPLAPPMAGPVEALTYWQDALRLRFLLIFRRFEAALAKSDPEFDAALLRLVRDPALDISLLLIMDEAAAPLLDRLRDDIPDLGEDYLRMPDLPPAAAMPAAAMPAAPPTAPPPVDRDAPLPETALHPWEPDPLSMAPDHDDRLDAPGEDLSETERATAEEQRLQRRRRSFSSLLEQASTAPAPQADAEFDVDDFAEFRWPEQYDEPDQPAAGVIGSDTLFAPPQAAPTPDTAPRYRERMPLPVSAWMQRRLPRRRRATVALAASTSAASTILFFFMLALALLSWELPQLPRQAAAPAAMRASAHGSTAAAPERHAGNGRRVAR